MYLELLPLLVAALITTEFLWWNEIADQNTKKIIFANSKKK